MSDSFNACIFVQIFARRREVVADYIESPPCGKVPKRLR